MPVVAPPVTNPPSLKFLDAICIPAMQEINRLGVGETPSADDSDFVLKKANRILDQWNAREVYVWNKQLTTGNLTPNLSPHLIGPGGSANFVVAQRPIRIEQNGAGLVINTSTPPVRVQLLQWDHERYARETVKTIATTVPFALYYEPDWPNGKLFLWPIPTATYGLELDTWNVLSQFATVQDNFSMPPGYQEALILTIAEGLLGPFGRANEQGLVADLKERAAAARRIVQAPNIESPTLETDAPTSDKGTYFNFYSGQVL